MMALRPFVGITGITTAEEVHALSAAWKGMQPGDHTLQLGLAVADYEIPSTPVRYVKNDAQIEALADAIGRENLTSAIHFNPEKSGETCIPELLRTLRATYASGTNHIVQVNTTEPMQDVLGAVKEAYPRMQVISQMGPNMLALGHRKIANVVRALRHEMDAVLLDVSRGQGISMDVHACLELAHAIKNVEPGMHVAFAGGFSSANAHERIARLHVGLTHSDFSVDAEGRLRNANDILVLHEAKQYLRACVLGFDTSSPPTAL